MSSDSTAFDFTRLVGRKQLSMTVSERWMAALSGATPEDSD